MTALELDRLLTRRCTRCGGEAPDHRNTCDDCASDAVARASRSRANRRAVLRELGLRARWRGPIADALRIVSGGAPVNTLDPDDAIAEI